MALGPYLAYDGVDYECTICERFFGSKSSFYAHCKQTSRHAWCERCCRLFISTPAENAHLLESSRHNICLRCPQPQDCNNLERFEVLHQAHEGNVVRHGDAETAILGFGTVCIEATSPSGGKVLIRLNDVAFIPGMHTSILSVLLIESDAANHIMRNVTKCEPLRSLANTDLDS